MATHEQQQTHLQFTQVPAFGLLKQLAQHPYDLTQPDALTPERIRQYCAQSCGFKLLYGTQRITEEVLEGLIALAEQKQALKQMTDMQNGAIVNFIEGCESEKRPALHTATRDFFDNPNQAPTAKNATQKARAEVDKLRAFMEKINHEKRFHTLIVIGIGGSELGPKAHYEALIHLSQPTRTVHFLANIDPDALGRLENEVDFQQSLVLVISKAGSTLETSTNEQLLRQRFIQKGLNPLEHFVAITSEGSPMDHPGHYLERFYMWDWIGGRYSTTSMCGGVLLSFAFGFEVYWQFLQGAHAMDKAALTPEVRSNLPLLAALLGIWNRTFLEHPTLGIIPYAQALARFPAHLQQLDMESNGKHIDKTGQFVNFPTGPIIFGEPGTNAQHSFYQLIHQGTTVVPLELIAFKEPQVAQNTEINGTDSQQKLLANTIAQSIALATGQKSNNRNKDFPGNRPTMLLLGKQLTPYVLGSLLAFYEHKIAFQGFIWGINSFDQEGVQLGKLLANKILDCFAKRQTAPYPVGEAFINLLEDIS